MVNFTFDMKLKNYYIAFIFCFIIIFSIWIAFYRWSDCFKDGTDDSHLNTAYVAAGALFTAIASLGTVVMLFCQHKTELKKTSLKIYTSVHSGMMRDPKFNDAFRYLLSRIDRKTKTVLEEKTIEQLKEEKIQLPKREITRLNSLLYFCDKMDYLGILIKKNYLDISLLYNNGYNIICAYRVLEKWSFFEGGNKQKYLHFRYLIYLIEKSNNQYLKYCNRIELEILRHENKKRLVIK